MQSEIEAKFVNVSIDDVREKLTSLGAECIAPMREMRRVTIDTPALKQKDAFVRVRDEGNRTTLTYKQFDALSVDGAKEIEVTVSDFEATIELLSQAGLPYGSMQESRRETWQLDCVEIMIDEWPWLPPYIEVEGKTEAEVKDTAAKLGFEWETAVFGDVMAAYRAQYPHLGEHDTVGNLPYVRFGDPLPDLFKF